MAMRYIESELKRMGEKDLAQDVAEVRGKLGRDIPIPASEPVRSEEGKASPLEIAIAEYRAQPLTPELVTKTWQIFLRSSVEKAGLSMPVGDIPACDRSREELEKLAKEGRFMVYVPDVDYPLLGKIFPKMRSRSVQEGSPVEDEHESHGWVDVEADLESPNRNTTEKKLEKLFKSQGKRGQTLRTYIWASQFNKALTGHYFDEKDTWSRLPGSRDGGSVVYARFVSGGGLLVDSHLDPQFRVPGLGGRSERVKKA